MNKEEYQFYLHYQAQWDKRSAEMHQFVTERLALLIRSEYKLGEGWRLIPMTNPSLTTEIVLTESAILVDVADSPEVDVISDFAGMVPAEILWSDEAVEKYNAEVKKLYEEEKS